MKIITCIDLDSSIHVYCPDVSSRSVPMYLTRETEYIERTAQRVPTQSLDDSDNQPATWLPR